MLRRTAEVVDTDRAKQPGHRPIDRQRMIGDRFEHGSDSLSRTRRLGQHEVGLALVRVPAFG